MTKTEAITRLSMIFANCDTEMCKGAYVCKYCDEAISMAINALQQEPKRGEWQRFNYSDGDVMECTNCGYRDWRDRWLEDEAHNYCPKCGAKMKGGDDEID